MKKILTLLSLSTFVFANSFSLDSVGINLGTSSLPYKQENKVGSVTLTDKVDETLKSFEIFSTFKSSNDFLNKYNLKPYTSYTYSSNSDLKHQYLLFGLNKEYTYKKALFYSGLLAGYGQVDWKRDPLNSSKDKNVDSNSFIAGLQLGVSYPLAKSFSLSLDGKYLLHDYETKLEPSSNIKAKLEHDETKIVSLGVKYSF